MAFQKNQKIYNLTLEELIGTGATAEVWRAVNSLGENIAVKLFNEDYLPDKQEVLTQHKVKHPNIIEVFDYHNEDIPICIEMEYAEQGTLQQYLEEQKQLQTEEAVEITIDIANALKAIHEKGIVHRDIKPSNILFVDNIPKLSDFGLAKAHKKEIENTLLTKSDTSGTMYFMAPESFDRKFTEQSDIYSLGAVMYFMLTGKIPLGAIDSPSEYNQEVSKSLDQTVIICLKHNPEKRFRNIPELIDSLTSIGAKKQGRLKNKKRNKTSYEFDESYEKGELQEKIKNLEEELSSIKRSKISFFNIVNKLIPDCKLFRNIFGVTILAPALLFGVYKGCSCLDQSANINYIGYSDEVDKLVDKAMPAIKERGFSEGFLCKRINSAYWSPDKKKLAIYTTRQKINGNKSTEGLFITNLDGTNTYEILRGGENHNAHSFHNITWIDKDSIYLCCILDMITSPFTSRHPYIQIDIDPVLNIIKDIKEYKPKP